MGFRIAWGDALGSAVDDSPGPDPPVNWEGRPYPDPGSLERNQAIRLMPMSDSLTFSDYAIWGGDPLPNLTGLYVGSAREFTQIRE